MGKLARKGSPGFASQRRSHPNCAWSNAPPSQPLPQSEPAFHQPTLHSRRRHVELPGRLDVCHSLEVAQLERATILRRQTVELFTHGSTQVPEFHLADRIVG